MRKARDEWAPLIPDDQWIIYQTAIMAISGIDRPFMLGGAFGLAGYTGHWRNTKDMDVYIHPSDRQPVIDALTKAGFDDYYERLAYDRGWIYRSIRNDVIVDVIWGTPNRLTEVTSEWFQHSRSVTVKGEQLRVIPPEEMLWIKLFVLQKDRCDWPDLLNILRCAGREIDWDRLLQMLGPDFGLFQGLMHVYNWLCPLEAMSLPTKVRERLKLADPSTEELNLALETRVCLLDSRPWFATFQPPGKPMQL